MLRYIFTRLLQLLPVLFVASIAIFALTKVLPGDPTITVLGENATLTQREALREELGLNQPIIAQYVAWLGNALRGDLGQSLRTGEPIAEMLANRLPITLELTFLSMVLAVAIGIPMGVVAAKWRNSWIDLGAGTFAMSGMAIPYFWFGVLLIMVFAVGLKWLPPSGYVPFFSDPATNLKLMILPAITVGTSMAALVMRQTRTSMLEALSQDYVRTARAKGLSEITVVLKHTLRNALNPVVTVVGLQFGALMGGAVVTEKIFSMPGLGRMVVDGIFDRDLAVVQGAVIAIVLAVTLVNLFTDLAYVVLDRRIKI
jgi:peptide/nickel transport system permease protein